MKEHSMSNQELIVGLTDAEAERMGILAQASRDLSETSTRILQEGWSSRLGNVHIDNRLALADAMAGCAVAGLVAAAAEDLDADVMEGLMEKRAGDMINKLKHQADSVIADLSDLTGVEIEIETGFGIIEPVTPMGIGANVGDSTLKNV